MSAHDGAHLASDQRHVAAAAAATCAAVAAAAIRARGMGAISVIQDDRSGVASLSTGTVVVAGMFLYTSITLASIVPSSAPADGGTLLTVHGSGFLTPGIPTNLARCRYTYPAGYYKPNATTLTMQEDVLVLALSESVVECEAIPSCGCGSGDAGRINV